MGSVLTFDVPDDPFLDHALGLLGRVCGVDAVRAPAGAAADVYYGDDGDRPCRVRIPSGGPYDERSVPGIPGEAQRPEAADPAAPFPFDLFAALRFWLADEGNAARDAGAWDAHGRLTAAGSVQEALGVREVPIVNAYLLLARAWLRARAGAPPGRHHLPEGRRALVVLSHDVDSPLNPVDLRPELRTAAVNAAGGRWRPALQQAGGAVARAAVFGALAPGRHWLFERVVEEERRRGFRSTFFFAAASRFRGGHALDVRYDVTTRRFRRVCRWLADEGWGVGLHIGYGAQDDAAVIARERAAIEAVSGRPVHGSRHHYWHMTRPVWGSLEAHGRAGLRYDSSVAFDDAPGYRLGVALPYRPWHPELGREVSALQVPTLAMDGTFFGNARPWRLRDRRRAAGPPPDVGGEFERLLAQLKRHEGVAAIDWHEYTSHPASPLRAWGRGYLDILDILAADPEVGVVTYDELAS